MNSNDTASLLRQLEEFGDRLESIEDAVRTQTKVMAEGVAALRNISEMIGMAGKI